MPYNSPYVGTIADLMGRQADIQAQRLQANAAAQARAQEIGGQVWGNAIGTIAQAAGQAAVGYSQAKARERLEARQTAQDALNAGLVTEQTTHLENQNREDVENKAYFSALDEAMRKTPKITEGTLQLYDVPAITDQLAQANFGHRVQGAATQLNAQNESYRAARNAQLQVVHTTVDRIRNSKAPIEQQASWALQAMDDMEANKLYTAEQLAPYRQAIYAKTENVTSVMNFFGSQPKPLVAAPGASVLDANNLGGGAVFTAPKATERKFTPVTVPIDGRPVTLDKEEGTGRYYEPLRPGQPETERKEVAAPPVPMAAEGNKERYRQILAAHAQGKVVSADDKAWGDAYLAEQMAAQEARDAKDVTKLSAQALLVAGYHYRVTGQLPALGMGDRSTRQEIMNVGAGMSPEDMAKVQAGGSIDMARAINMADSAALRTLTQQQATLGAFEKTAKANLQVFINEAKKISDSGSPLINRPLREIEQQLLGDKQMAAFNVSRSTVVPEFAKLLSGGGIGQVLSDDQRKEIMQQLPDNATLGQYLEAARILLTDVNNRTGSLQSEIKEIQGRLRQNPAFGAAPAGGGPVTVNGFTFPNQAAADAYKRAVGIP